MAGIHALTIPVVFGVHPRIRFKLVSFKDCDKFCPVTRESRSDIAERTGLLFIRNVMASEKPEEVNYDVRGILGLDCGYTEYFADSQRKLSVRQSRNVIQTLKYKLNSGVPEEKDTTIFNAPISSIELRSSLKCLKTSKFPGEDGLFFQLLKHLGPRAFESILRLFIKMCSSRYIHSHWCSCCASLESEEQFESRLIVCEGCGHISLSGERPATAQVTRAQGGPHVRKNPGRQRPTPQLLWGPSCFAVED
ncbi:hypothetical protein CDAR_478971 [Caerostris darwini]|uniref:Uncharacterized protein n=1 Tax=Caerostris darwini TaxID=1538125 RepID=A0AAV4RS61_9ARAC|nr:hypothetical protein CDAR_478971 [Caerostris darwini]